MVVTRREFLGAGAAAVLASRFGWAAETKLPLAFSTLGCPTWEWMKVLEFAQANGYAAIELRGVKGNLDLPACPEFARDRTERQARYAVVCNLIALPRRIGL